MKKIVRLTESDLVRIVQKVLNEQPTPPEDLKKSEPLSPEERSSELKKQDEEIRRLEIELKNIKSEITEARIENIEETKTKIVSKIKQFIAKIDEIKDYKKMNKQDSKVKQLERNKIRLEDKLRRIETGEGRTPEQKKEIINVLKEVAFGLGTYITGLFAFFKLRGKNPDKFRELGF